ncbi:hypothetical protein FB446DRAFT_783394 [Lentinula raphanica]|nr:hypothetical protein C8R42DRAFT_720326 [Lentinula raphanica]KAJ3778386.1 hypothetical protein FB446DRAFT_783394 [Lentinula raphanica]
MFSAIRLISSARFLRARHLQQPISFNRTICFSSPRRASESPYPPPEEMYSRLNSTSLAKKLQNSPEAMQAIRDFMVVLQNQGLDLSTGKPPSPMQLMKLGMKKEVREEMMKMTAEMQKAGIDLTDKDMIAELMAAMKKP